MNIFQAHSLILEEYRRSVRSFLSPAARHEVLHRLLALNLETAAREAGQTS